MQYFFGEKYFHRAFPLERSGMTHFRRRVGEQALETVLLTAIEQLARQRRKPDCVCAGPACAWRDVLQ